jgi:c-di-AMP phosphodiesterase-like protein
LTQLDNIDLSKNNFSDDEQTRINQLILKSIINWED